MTEATITIRISGPKGTVVIDMETLSADDDEMLDAVVRAAVRKAKAARDAK